MEPETFHNPLFDATKGDSYHQQYINNLTSLFKHPLFQTALRKLPRSDEDAVRAAVPEELERNRLLYSLAFVRWSNPICDFCLDKSNPAALFPCQECGLTFYCSAEHQVEHKAKHSLRCCNLDGPLDDGPMSLAFITAKIHQ
jgi:hypothetical protein